MRILWQLMCLLILVKSVVVINLIVAKLFHGLDHIITAHILRWIPKMHFCISFNSHRHIYLGGSTVCCL